MAHTRNSVRPVRVLFLNTRDSHGADVAVHVALARGLDRRHASVWFATGAHEAPNGVSTLAALALAPHVTVVRANLGRPLSGRRGLSRLRGVAANSAAAVTLVRMALLCRRQRIDAVHVTERPRDLLFGWVVARLGGTRVLNHLHTNYYAHDVSRLSRWALRHGDAAVAVSHFTAATYATDPGLRLSRVSAIHNAVDVTLFRPPASLQTRISMRERLGIPDDAVAVGCVGRLMRWKRQTDLLEAFVQVRKRLPSARLVLAGTSQDVSPTGSGDYRDYLVERARALGIEDAVVLPGFVQTTDMPAFYAALDLLVHPAVDEPFGLAIAEALACAVPVIAVAAGGVPEIIRDGIDGVLVPPANPGAIAEAIERITSRPEERLALAAAGRDRIVDAFSGPRQASEFLAVYEGLAAGRTRVAASQSADLLPNQE